jgi:hypothetical protein
MNLSTIKLKDIFCSRKVVVSSQIYILKDELNNIFTNSQI